jgi:hypothetical protein
MSNIQFVPLICFPLKITSYWKCISKAQKVHNIENFLPLPYNFHTTVLNNLPHFCPFSFFQTQLWNDTLTSCMATSKVLHRMWHVTYFWCVPSVLPPYNKFQSKLWNMFLLSLHIVVTVDLNAPWHWQHWIFHQWCGLAATTMEIISCLFTIFNMYVLFKCSSLA